MLKLIMKEHVFYPSASYKWLQFRYGMSFFGPLILLIFFLLRILGDGILGRENSVIVFYAILICLLLLGPAIHFFSNIFIRRIIITPDSIINIKGIPYGATRIFLKNVYAYKLNIDTKFSNRLVIGGFMGIGIMPKYAAKKLLLLGKEGQIVDELDIFEFNDNLPNQLESVIKHSNHSITTGA